MFDKLNMFSDAQAIAASAASTHVVDLGSDRNIGVGEPVVIRHRVVEDFDELTSLTIAVQTADTDAFTGGGTTLVSVTLPLADLKAGATSPLITLPRGVRRYLRLNYTVAGDPPTQGAITAGLAASEHDWQPYPAVTGGPS